MQGNQGASKSKCARLVGCTGTVKFSRRLPPGAFTPEHGAIPETENSHLPAPSSGPSLCDLREGGRGWPGQARRPGEGKA